MVLRVGGYFYLINIKLLYADHRCNVFYSECSLNNHAILGLKKDYTIGKRFSKREFREVSWGAGSKCNIHMYCIDPE